MHLFQKLSVKCIFLCWTGYIGKPLRTMLSALKREFRTKQLGLTFHQPEAFCQSMWRWPKLVFVLVRLVLAAYSLFALIGFIVNLLDAKHVIVVYLTTWTFIVETLFFVMGAGLAVLHALRPGLFARTGGGSSTAGAVTLSTEKAAVATAWSRADSSSEGPPVLAMNGHSSKDTARAGTSTAVAHRPQDLAMVDLQLQDRTKRHETGEPEPEKLAKSSQSSRAGPEVQAQNVVAGAGGVGDGRVEEEEEQLGKAMPWYLKVYWVLGNITQVFPIIVTIVFFVALFKGKVIWYDLNVHGVNSLMVLVDLGLSARPVRLLHALHPMLYGLLYVAFSAAYWAVNPQRNVLYPVVLDWNRPATTCGVVAGMALVAIPLLHLLNLGLYRLKLIVRSKLYGQAQGPADR